MFTRSCGKFHNNSIFFAPVQNIFMDYVTKVTNLNDFKKRAGGSSLLSVSLWDEILASQFLYIYNCYFLLHFDHILSIHYESLS